jgi:hypothetical protein
MSQSTKMPERKLRHEGAARATGQPADKAASIDPAKASATRTSSSDDSTGNTMLDPASPVFRALRFGISPLSLWRMLPADLLGAADLLELCSALDEIATMPEGSGLEPALDGDPDAAIAFVLSAMPIRKIDLQVEIAMTAVLRCALDGDLRAALVLAHVIDRADLDPRHTADLCASWFEYYLRNSSARSIT